MSERTDDYKKPYYYRDQLYIEITNNCNIKCTYCTNPTIKKEDRGVMTNQLFKKIIDQVELHPEINSINLVGMGETFLNPNVSEMVEYAYQKNIPCYACTNLKYSLNTEMLRTISKFVNIHCTIDGVTTETLSHSRPNTDVNLLWENVEKILDYKRKYNIQNFHFEVRINLFLFNKHELFKVIERAKKYGADSVWIAKGAGSKVHEAELTQQEWDSLDHDYVRTSGFIFSSQLATDEQTDLNNWRKEVNASSNLLDKMDCVGPTVHWDGKYSPCCFDFHKTIKYGDLNNTSINDLWSKQQVDSFANSLITEHEKRIKSGNIIQCDKCQNFLGYMRDNCNYKT